jgi:hypothetical protein
MIGVGESHNNAEQKQSKKRNPNGHQEVVRKSSAGRKALYSEELASAFLDELASGKSLRKVCSKAGMPSIQTVLKWERENEAFSARYMQARDDRGMAFGEKIIDLVEDVIASKIQVDAARLAIDSLKWTAARLAPKVYGDKQQVDINQTVNVAITHAKELMEVSRAAREATYIDVTPDTTSVLKTSGSLDKSKT